MKHIVMFSGGVGSWATAKRVAERHGTDDLILLFADTKMEDEDLYRFLDEAAADTGGQLVKVAEGRDPWEVFFDVKFLGNSLVDPCSRVLKRELVQAGKDSALPHFIAIVKELEEKCGFEFAPLDNEAEESTLSG